MYILQYIYINDYVNSCSPLFDTDKVIPNTINFIFGTISGKLQLPDECLGQIVELETVGAIASK